MTEKIVTVKVEIPAQDLWEAVFGSAFESFGDHWQEVQYLDGANWDKIGKVRLVCHNENYENVEKIIGIEELAEALPKANAQVYMDLFNFDNYDAICGDAVLQTAVIGSVVFG